MAAMIFWWYHTKLSNLKGKCDLYTCKTCIFGFPIHFSYKKMQLDICTQKHKLPPYSSGTNNTCSTILLAISISQEIYIQYILAKHQGDIIVVLNKYAVTHPFRHKPLSVQPSARVHLFKMSIHIATCCVWPRHVTSHYNVFIIYSLNIRSTQHVRNPWSKHAKSTELYYNLLQYISVCIYTKFRIKQYHIPLDKYILPLLLHKPYQHASLGHFFIVLKFWYKHWYPW